MKYRALGHINHNNEHYNTGDEIELSSAEAAPLLEVKAIEPLIKRFSKQASAESSEVSGNV